MQNYTCIAVDDSDVQLVILKNYVKKISRLELKAAFNNPVEAFEYLGKNEIDILLLDIDMPEISGLDLLKMLPKKPQTILITSKLEFALEAFELDAIDYIIKPPEYPRFLKAVTKAISFLESKSSSIVSNEATEEEIYVKINSKLVRLEVNLIDYFEAMSDYVIIHTEEKRQYIVYSTLKQFEEKMQAYQKFKRIHRSYLINISKIKSIEDGQVLINEKTLPIGNTYKEEFLKNLNKM
jgi:DNA-binding LytR/AlgR family response regulator